jgi:hypothetical protein
MDPKALSHLDPKQKDAYARVMGTAAEIHSDTNQPQTSTDPLTALTSADPAVQPTTSTPFDISTGGLSSSPSIDTTHSLTPPLPAPENTANDPSPSIFSSSSSPDTAPDAALSPTLSTAPDSPSSSPDTNFFSSSPIPSTPETPDIQPELAPPEAFPQINPEQNTTIASDNLAPVTPYDPSSETNQPTAPVSMEQPFTAQQLPSPAEVNQANAQKESSPLLRVLYIVGAVVFFAIYTIFWIKVFNLPFIF